MNHRTLLRSILLLLALIFAAELGEAKTTSTKERLVAEVARLGGTIEFDETLASRPIVKIDLHATQVTDSELALLQDAKQELKTLRYLDLRLTKIGNEGIGKLKHLTSLQTLNLFRTQLGDKGLAQLKKLTNLETLLIGGTQITDGGLVYLRPFRKLRKLSLFQTQITDDGIAHLKIMESLEVLLIGGSKITPAGAEELQKALPKVRFSENT